MSVRSSRVIIISALVSLSNTYGCASDDGNPTGVDSGNTPPVNTGMDAAGSFWFVAQDQDQPRREFVFRVNDGRGGSDSTCFFIRADQP